MNPIALIERLLQLIPVLLGISVIVFSMMALTPGDPVDVMLGDSLATPEQRATMRRDMGLDGALTDRFVAFISNAVRGEFTPRGGIPFWPTFKFKASDAPDEAGGVDLFNLFSNPRV